MQIAVAPDTTKGTQAVTDFVTAYNTIIQDLTSQFTFNTTTSSAGPLSTDAGARLVQNELLAAVTYTGTGTSPINSLSDLGVSMNNDGTLTIDNSKLSAAVNSNFADVINFFHPVTGTGFASFLTGSADSVDRPDPGRILHRAQRLESIGQKSFQDQIDNYEVYIATEQTALDPAIHAG